MVQGSIAETLPGRKPFTFGNLGERSLKGFEQTVRAFAVTLEADKTMPALEARPNANKPSIAVLPFNKMSSSTLPFGSGP